MLFIFSLFLTLRLSTLSRIVMFCMFVITIMIFYSLYISDFVLWLLLQWLHQLLQLCRIQISFNLLKAFLEMKIWIAWVFNVFYLIFCVHLNFPRMNREYNRIIYWLNSQNPFLFYCQCKIIIWCRLLCREAGKFIGNW